MYVGNASFIIVMLICNTNTTLCAECPENVSIIIPVGPPYTAGDVLTCSTDGYPASYEWTVDGNDVSSASTCPLEEGEHVYECTVSVTIDDGEPCAITATHTLTAFSKYQTLKEHNNIEHIIVLNSTVVNVTACMLTGILLLHKIAICDTHEACIIPLKTLRRNLLVYSTMEKWALMHFPCIIS